MSHFPSDAYRRGAANRDPEEEALGWVVRLTSGDVTEADRQEFANWHADAGNATAYRGARRLWAGLGPVLEDRVTTGWADCEPGTMPPGRDRSTARMTPQRASFAVGSGRLRHMAIAASLAVATISGAYYVRTWGYDHVSGTAVAAHTLIDGTRIVLGPETALDTRFDHGVRQVTLVRGEALFDVRRDPAHPFVISAGNGVVRVLGTAFSVRRTDDGGATVTVVRGRVEVTSGDRSAILTPDQQISFGLDGLHRMLAVESSLATAWMRGRLILEEKPLSTVLAEVDRYRGGRTILFNNEAKRRKVSAVVDLAHIDEWLAALASSQGLKRTTIGSLTFLR